MKRRTAWNSEEQPRRKYEHSRQSQNSSAHVFELSVHERDHDKVFPNFRKPAELGFFSHDSERKFQHDRSQLKFLHLPSNMNSVYFDLKDGYEKMIRKDDSQKEYLDDLLRWILENTDKFLIQNSASESKYTDSLNTDFICWRGLLTRLLCTPFENRDDWMIAVSRFRGTLYMCEFETPKREQEREKMVGRQLEMCCWGWKFEQYLTKDSPDGMPDTSVPVNNNEDGASVVRSRLNSHSLVFAGEVDAVEPNQKDTCKYVELKTTQEIETPRQNENFARFKLIKWWAQSYVIGIPRIICGFRDDDGIVHRLQDMSTPDLPKKAQGLRSPWKPNVCFNFLDKFLEYVKEVVKENDPRVVYVFSWAPRQQVSFERYKNSKFNFLPEWFTGWEGWSRT